MRLVLESRFFFLVFSVFLHFIGDLERSLVHAQWSCRGIFIKGVGTERREVVEVESSGELLALALLQGTSTEVA